MSQARIGALAIIATVLAATPAFTADSGTACVAAKPTDYMQIHMDNQRIDSAVTLFWKLQTAAWRAACQ